jgi:hypothetical protein
MPAIPKQPLTEKPTVAVIEGRPEYQASFERPPNHARLPAVLLLDASLVGFAKARGFEEPSPTLTSTSFVRKGVTMMSPLRDYLLDTYEFADARRSNRAGDVCIGIDDRGGQDVVSSFCTMTVRVPDSSGDSLILSIQHIPLTERSRSLIEDQGGNIREFPDGYRAEITLSVTSVTFIRKLARAIRQTTGRGKRYDHPNWKWICPRTAASLERFATVLKTYNAERE